MEQIKYDEEATKELLNHDSWINDNGYFKEAVIKLLEKGACPNLACAPDGYYPYTSMEWAMTQAEDEVMELMFEKGAIITPRTYEAFIWGHNHDLGHICLPYWTSQENPWQIFETPFRNTIVIGRILLEHGLDPESRTQSNDWNVKTDKTFREYLDGTCNAAIAYAERHEKDANILNKEVEAYQNALKKADEIWKIDIKELNADIALKTAVLRIKEAQRRAAQKNSARKPSAILEEIEGMFGAPDFTIE